MKKIKFMLISLALTAIVGGALAFKAKYNLDYCTAITVAGKSCTNIFCANERRMSTPGLIGTKICTTPMPVGGCNSFLMCTTTSTFPLVVD